MRYGPVIVLSCLFGLAISFAPLFNMAVFLKPISREFGWSRTEVSGLTAAATLSMALVAPFVGRIIDRIGPRRLIAVSAAGFSASLAGFAFLPHVYPVFLLMGVLVGVTGAGTTPLAYLALVSRWFDRRLGLALGVAMIGIGVGVALSPVIGNELVSHFGLRGAFLGMAAIAATAIPNAVFVLREPGGWIGQADARPAGPAPTRPFARIARSPVFWLLAAGMFLMTVAVAGCGVHLIALLTDRGYSPASAAGVASMGGVGLLLGRLSTGYLLDRAPVGALAAATFLGGAGGVAILAGGIGGAGPIVATGLIGFAQGAEGNVMAYAVRRYFRLEAYGLTYGLIFGAFNLGAFIGPVSMAAAFDQLGSYEPSLWVFVALALIAAGLVFLVRAPDPGSAGDLASRPLSATSGP